MPHRPPHQNPEEGDRLTGQPGLALGSCLDPDQLADLASNHCSPKERQAALAHLSSCRTCCDAWVAVSLSLVAMESGLERRRRPLFSLKNLVYLGAAMFLAASMVLFFSLPWGP